MESNDVVKYGWVDADVVGTLLVLNVEVEIEEDMWLL